MKLRVSAPTDPRAAPIHALGRMMPLPGEDDEAAEEALLIEEMDAAEADPPAKT